MKEIVLSIGLIAFTSTTSFAQSAEVTARGNGKIPATHCVVDPATSKFGCFASSSGTDYSFSFRGPSGKDVPGSVTIRDSDLRVNVRTLAAIGVIDTMTNTVKWSGTCEVSTDKGPVKLPCHGTAVDQGEPGADDLGQFTYGSLGKDVSGSGNGQFMSGGVQID